MQGVEICSSEEVDYYNKDFCVLTVICMSLLNFQSLRFTLQSV